MNNTTTWKTTCRKCESNVYYYPAKLVLESTTQPLSLDKRIVDCTCDNKHHITYEFPTQFSLLN